MTSKYRAWDKENKRMIYPSTDSVYFEITDDGINILDMSVEPFDDVFPHLDSVLMQSTGLKDKNGMEIFEGDILVNQYGNVGYVAYLQQEAGFVVVKKKSDYRLGHRNTGESYDVSNNHEVIGNFWENPNLLEQANEN